MSEIHNWEQEFYNYIEEITKETCMIAFSGGVDSSLILQIACFYAAKHQTTVYAVTISTKLHPMGDLAIAQKVAAEAGAVHKVLVIDELVEAGIEENPINRCYLCKKAIFQKIQNLATQYQIVNILEGTNADDLLEYRPGIQALKELQIHSPLAESGITKEQVRLLAAKWGISVADRPSSPCLATRLPYGTKIDYELLSRIDQGEKLIRNLGFYNVRLRVHGEVARIEVDEDSFGVLLKQHKIIVSELKKLGFTYVTLDLDGFHSGSMDYKIQNKK